MIDAGADLTPQWRAICCAPLGGLSLQGNFNLTVPSLGPLEVDPHVPLLQRIEDVRATNTDPWQRAQFDAIMKSVDVGRFAALQEKYAGSPDQYDPKGMVKYLDICFWISHKINLARSLGFTPAPPRRRLLDIGSGAGHFPAAVAHLGHETMGLDLDIPFYRDVTDLLGVKVHIVRIEPDKPLPDIGRFTDITALAIKFDSIGTNPDGSRAHWTFENWREFLTRLTADNMEFPGRLLLQLNARYLPDGTRTYDEELFARCQDLGATVKKADGWIQFALNAPLRF